MRTLPIGQQDFATVREEDYYYVDKSMLIGQILDQNRRGAFLFTRPRRFGKSLNLSMLNCFFNIEYEGNTWFDGLEISDHPEYDRYRNRFPVVMFDFKDLGDGDSFDDFLDNMGIRMHTLMKRYEFLMESDKLSQGWKKRYSELYYGKRGRAELLESIIHLVSCLHTHHSSEVIILFDEYDSPMNSTYGKKCSDQVRGFMKQFLSSVLKGNEDVQMAVVTGIMQIAKESIFSGLNNLYVNNILSKRFDEMFGFTDVEVQKICTDYGHPEKYAEAKEWYDGYRFGDADVYNPWSVLNYVNEDFVPAPYWARTSGNDIIGSLLDNADEGTIDDLRILGEGGAISTWIDSTVTYSELLGNKDVVFSVMAMSGYLKVTVDKIGGMFLSIPNRELFSVFSSKILSKTAPVLSGVSHLTNALFRNDLTNIERILGDLIMKSVSCRMLDNEHSYQAFLLGLLMSSAGRYRVTGDFESGNGYHDIRMERLKGDSPNIVIEIKKGRDGQDVQALAEEALKQIHNTGYYQGLTGRTIIYGVAFKGKIPTIVSETMDL